MARLSIDKATVRNRLQSRREPYWGAPIARGLFLGFRRTDQGGTWIARLHDDDKRHRYHSIGEVTAELDYEAARREAIRWRKTVEAGVAPQDVDTVADACADYVKALRKDKRESAARDAERRFARTIDADPLGRVKLAKLRERHLEDWRERMESGELPSFPSCPRDKAGRQSQSRYPRRRLSAP